MRLLLRTIRKEHYPLYIRCPCTSYYTFYIHLLFSALSQDLRPLPFWSSPIVPLQVFSSELSVGVLSAKVFLVAISDLV